jgi:hypothetical protein
LRILQAVSANKIQANTINIFASLINQLSKYSNYRACLITYS